jgi:hypothetical protein
MTLLETGGNRSESVTSSDLRAAASGHEAIGALRREIPRLRPLRFQHLKPWSIDRFERQLRLETRLGRGMQSSGGAERPVPIHLRPVTLKTQRPRPRSPVRQLHVITGSPSIGRIKAGRAPHRRGLSLEFASRECHPSV